MLSHSRVKNDFATLIALTGTLVIIGLLFIYSSSFMYAAQRFGIAHYFLQKQIIGALIGILGFFIARTLSFDILYAYTPLFFFGSWFLTALTLIGKFSHTIHGSSRWLAIGSFSFQPSELLKIAFIMYLARFLAKREKKSFTFVSAYLPFCILVGLTGGVLLCQPDFGLAMTLIATAVSLLFITGFPLTHLLAAGLAAIPAVAALIYTQPYRMQRILTFLDPWKDPRGTGFQIIQSLIAIGSGSWWGSGISHSKQKFFYLPMQHTDFIFSIIAEETGFVGCSCIILLCVLFTYYGMKVAWQLKNSFATFTTLGFTILISMQTLINICVATGLLPTKGIGLPFISYGNSSLVCFLCMMGIMANFVENKS